MGDNETVVAQTSTAMGYTNAGFSSTDNGNPSSNAASEAVTFADRSSGKLAVSDAMTTTGDLAASADVADAAITVPDGSNEAVGAYSTESNSVMQEAPTTMDLDSKSSYGVANTGENLPGPADAKADSSCVTGYDSSINGNGVSEARNVVINGTCENGNPADNVHEFASEHQPMDGSVSAEEERLWSIVRTNSLDFNAWTTPIEETEKVSEEDNIEDECLQEEWSRLALICTQILEDPNQQSEGYLNSSIMDSEAWNGNTGLIYRPTDCLCGIRASIEIMEEDMPSQGQLYFICSKPLPQRCDFFEWCVPETCTSMGGQITNTNVNLEHLREQVRSIKILIIKGYILLFVVALAIVVFK